MSSLGALVRCCVDLTSLSVKFLTSLQLFRSIYVVAEFRAEHCTVLSGVYIELKNWGLIGLTFAQ